MATDEIAQVFWACTVCVRWQCAFTYFTKSSMICLPDTFIANNWGASSDIPDRPTQIPEFVWNSFRIVAVASSIGRSSRREGISLLFGRDLLTDTNFQLHLNWSDVDLRLANKQSRYTRQFCRSVLWSGEGELNGSVAVDQVSYSISGLFIAFRLF